MKQRPAESLGLAHRASTPNEAEIVRAVLEDAGLYAIVPDKNTPLPIDLTPLDGEYSLSGCDILVKASDVKQAKQVIAEAREAGDLDEENDFEDDEDDEAEEDDDEDNDDFEDDDE